MGRPPFCPAFAAIADAASDRVCLGCRPDRVQSNPAQLGRDLIGRDLIGRDLIGRDLIGRDLID